MATYTMDGYQKKMRMMASQLRRASRNSTTNAAMFMLRTAQGMAPFKTGDLRAGIKARHIKDSEWEVSSSVPKAFPYNLWVNQNAPYRTIKAVWNARQPTVYGDGTHTVTGTPRYWHFATIRTVAIFGSIVRKNIGKMLKVRIT